MASGGVDPVPLQIQPEELTFIGPFDSNVSSVLQITNQSTNNVLFKVKTIEALAAGKDQFNGSGLQIDYLSIETTRKISDHDIKTEFDKYKKDRKNPKSVRVACRFIPQLSDQEKQKNDVPKKDSSAENHHGINDEVWGLQHDLSCQMETFKKKYQDELEVNVKLRTDQDNLIDQIKEMEEINSREIAQLAEKIKKMVENEVTIGLKLNTATEENIRLTQQVKGLQQLLLQKHQANSPTGSNIAENESSMLSDDDNIVCPECGNKFSSATLYITAQEDDS